VAADRATARPEGGLNDIREATQSLVDTLNNQGKAGLSHSGVVKTLFLTTADQEVYHGLNRVPTICDAVMKNAAEHVFVGAAHEDPRNYINVQASGTVTANVLIS
jgi:hypothetical protein